MRRVAATFLAACCAASACAFGSHGGATHGDAVWGWPRTHTSTSGDRVVLSSLQVDEWRDRTMFAKCVASVYVRGALAPTIGTVSLRATTALERSDRMVVLTAITVPALRFPTDAEGIVPITAALTDAFTGAILRVPLDALLATMAATAFAEPPKEPTSAPGLSISLETLLRSTPANFEVVLASQLDGCANSRVPLFRTADGSYLVLIAGQWYSSDSLQDGPWLWVAPSQLPSILREIPPASRWGAALTHVPATPQWREATQLAAIASPASVAPTTARAALEAWWNPWDGAWWSNDERASARTARLATATLCVADSFRFDELSEDLFVGLDGRVYAQRGESWLRLTPEGTWAPFTEQRSTLRVLKDFARARTAAASRRTAYDSWRRAQLARDASDPATSSSEHLSMAGSQPSYDGFRHALQPHDAAPE